MARENAFPLIAIPLLFGVIVSLFPSVASITGVCYGMIGDNLPSKSDVVHQYQSYGILAMRIYKPDGDTFNALKGTDIDVMVGVPNEELALYANDASAAASWVQNNILAYDGVSFKYIAVGNEVSGDDANNILPAMSKIWDAICSAGRQDRIMVSTAVRFDVLNNTYPPSNSVFSAPFMGPIVQFLNNTGNPLFANIYPYFAYVGNQGDIPLDYALFTATGTVVSDGQFQYQNLFSAMVDSVYSALEKAGGNNVPVVVSETGWPSYGGVGATVQNAQTYNQNLIRFLNYGTPRVPAYMEGYIFAMFNENQKPGDEVERNFGLFNPNQSPVYPIYFN
ncbi:hypothetical protein LUZ62_034526 [Rhynchospora pubera]|uniref:Uncharacterized protein n=1 Tax=Rhynchospora pubera TaxID=906938 RepID=A0AAV8ESZ2_9POAL|nr:hypothetical protein LUZ62_060046 [Rhynchospora pubera]KAJ4783280.1 hypothetical protein LUZ62_034526 [Rhynchospora pubera]